MLFLKRLPSILYNNQNLIFLLTLLQLCMLYLLFRWNIICFNFQSRRLAKQVCLNYELGKAVGTFCSPLCTSHTIHSLNCRYFLPKNKNVFYAEYYDTTIVFKSPLRSIQPLHWYENDLVKYPTEEHFLATIRSIVKNRFNVTISQKLGRTLTHLRLKYDKEDKPVRHAEMDNIWFLLHDNEYLLSVLYTDADIFQQLLGTCGTYYAVEYIEPVESFTSVLSADCNLDEWERRVKTAILLIELLEEMYKEFQNIFHLCNIQLEHFGIVSNKNRIKFIDTSGLYTNNQIKNYLQNKECESDSDCRYYDCKAKCAKDKKCSIVYNNNFQILCEKIFLGWRMSSKILLPGLLISHHTPSELASLLRQCAHHNYEDRVGNVSEDELRKNLYNLLIEIDQTFNGEIY